MARSIAQQSADNQKRRDDARASAVQYNETYGYKPGDSGYRDPDAAEDGAETKPTSETGEALPVERDAGGHIVTQYDASGKATYGNPATVAAINGANSGKDPVGDSAAARDLRQQLIDERNALTPTSAPYIEAQGPMGAAMVDPVGAVTAPTIASTGPIAAPTVTAPQLGEIERIGAAQVAKGPQAEAGVVQAATLDKDPQNAIRARQESYIAALEAAARGEVPSAAELQLRRGTEEATASQLGLVAMNRGRGQGAALAQAGMNVAKLQQKANLDAALLRATEQEKARGLLGGALQGTREQDIGVATTEGQFKQGANTTNAQLETTVSISNADREAARLKTNAELLQRAAEGDAAAANELNIRKGEMSLDASKTTAGLSVDVGKSNQSTEAQKNLAQAELDLKAQTTTAANDLQRALANAGFNQQTIMATSAQDLQRLLANAGFQLTQQQIDEMKRNAATQAALTAQGQMLDFDTAQSQMDTQKEMQRIQLQSQYDQAKKANDTSTMNAVISAAATAGIALITALSDERAKKKIRRSSDGEVDDFLAALESWNYEYKDKADGQGRKSGPMAQELERSAIGRSVVRTDEKGRKGIDTAALTMALAGAVARMAKQRRRAA